MDEQELEVLQDLESGLVETEPLEAPEALEVPETSESSEAPDNLVTTEDSGKVLALGATAASNDPWPTRAWDNTYYNQGTLSEKIMHQQIYSSTHDLFARMDTLEGNVIAAVGSGSGSGGAPDEDAVYTVVLDSSQADSCRSAARVLCTEGLLIVLLLALLCGMQAWRIFSSKWVGV